MAQPARHLVNVSATVGESENPLTPNPHSPHHQKKKRKTNNQFPGRDAATQVKWPMPMFHWASTNNEFGFAEPADVQEMDINQPESIKTRKCSRNTSNLSTDRAPNCDAPPSPSQPAQTQAPINKKGQDDKGDEEDKEDMAFLYPSKPRWQRRVYPQAPVSEDDQADQKNEEDEEDMTPPPAPQLRHRFPVQTHTLINNEDWDNREDGQDEEDTVMEFIGLHNIPYIFLSPDSQPYLSIDKFLTLPDRYQNLSRFAPIGLFP